MNEDNAVLNSVMLNLMDKSQTSIYQILPKGYIVLNLRGTILGYNSKCEKLLGLTDCGVGVKKMSDFLTDKNKGKFSTMLEFVQLNGQIDDFELEITKPDGQIKIFWISASAIYDSNKNAIALHGLISDMTKEHMFLNQIKEELQTFRDCG